MQTHEIGLLENMIRLKKKCAFHISFEIVHVLECVNLQC